ncbi:SulP family inorganic anion transporter [Catenulispora yoronensis]|uniref:SulP family inorganic anion transporter n=1 Tax=Catenulispora yoronensis TaxID=450799 RepID=A0ABP5FQ26_9ACTN
MTACAILVPEGVAYAGIAGVPPSVAFYTAPIVLFLYALLGTSQTLIVGATAAASVFSAATVGSMSHDPVRVLQLTAALSVLTGLVLLATGLARCGFIADFLEPSALVGFLFGMALAIDARQAPKLVGIEGHDGDFFDRFWELFRRIGDWSMVSLMVGGLALFAIVVLEQRLPRIPSALVVLAAGIGVSPGFDLSAHGIAVVGRIPAAVPSWRPPTVDRSSWTHLAGGALGLALIVFAVSFGLAQRLDRESGGGDGNGDRDGAGAGAGNVPATTSRSAGSWLAFRPLDANREMIALGAANLGAGLVGGFAVTGSASASPAAVKAGGRTRVASLVAAMVALGVGAVATPVIRPLPEPVLAAIVVGAVRELVNFKTLMRYWRTSRRSLLICLTAVFGVLLFQLLAGLLMAVLLSLILFIAEVSRLKVSVIGLLPGTDDYVAVDRYPEARTVPVLLILRPDGGAFYGNARRLRGAVVSEVRAQEGPVSTVVLDLAASFHLDAPTLDMLSELRADLDRLGISLAFAHLYRGSATAVAAGKLADVRVYLGLDEAMADVAPETETATTP